MTQPVDDPEVRSGQWFVIWAESRAEKKVSKRLQSMGLSVWLPVVSERHRWSDRWKDVECPLFPGYLFARASGADWHRILRTPGVLTVITENGKPAVLSDAFVAALRDAIGRSGAEPESVDESVDYAVGDEVIVLEGPLLGVRGVVRDLRGRRRLVIWVAEIGRGVAFTIDSALVKARRAA
jgi:transcription antitermination factor NusG